MAPAMGGESDTTVVEGWLPADCRRLLCYVQFAERLRWALLGFLVYVGLAVCIATALHELRAPDELAQVQRKLWGQLALGEASTVSDVGQVSQFLATFAAGAAELRPASGRLWCENRYFSKQWDDVLGVPVRSCASPRQHGLGVPGRPLWQQEQRDAVNGSSCNDTESDLRMFTGNESATCDGDPEVFCSHAMTAQYCRATCGYCGPFAYDRLAGFPGGLLAVAPAAVFQTRLEITACGRFAERLGRFGRIGAAPAVGSLADGVAALSCAARGSLATAWSALSLPCAWGKPCREDGTMAFSERHRFRGHDVYAESLADAAVDVARLRDLGWLDGLTDSVTVALVVYAPSIAVYTYLAVEFQVDAAGGVHTDISLESYREPSSRPTLIAKLVSCFVISMVWLAVIILRSSKPEAPIFRELGVPSFPASLFIEGVVVLVVWVFSLVLLVQWSLTPWGKRLDDLLLESSLPDTSSGDATDLISNGGVPPAFFKLAEEVLSVTSTLARARSGGYFILMIMVVPALRCFFIHPTFDKRTFLLGLVEFTHAGFTFLSVFFFVAFAGHLALGAYFEPWSSASAAVAAQVQAAVHGSTLRSAIMAGHNVGPERAVGRLYVAILLLIVCFVAMLFVPAVMLDAMGISRRLSSSRTSPETPGKGQGGTAAGILRAVASSPARDVLDALLDVYWFPLWSPHRYGLKTALEAACQQEDFGTAMPSLTDLVEEHTPDATANDVIEIMKVVERYRSRCHEPAAEEEEEEEVATQAPVLPLTAPDEDTPLFADVPYLDQGAQAKMRGDIMENVERWLLVAPSIGITWEELAPAMSCSILQEAMLVIGESKHLLELQSQPPPAALMDVFPPAAPAGLGNNPLPPASEPLSPLPPLPGTPVGPEEEEAHDRLALPAGVDREPDAISLAGSDESI